ncbi:MAG: hypothetical protein AB8W37_03955 [Arsenophonus endosymbiont of Dermacentor nuttalli]
MMYASDIQKVSNNNKDLVACAPYPVQPMIAFNHKINDSIDKSRYASFSHRIYQAKINMPDQKMVIVMSFDRQLNLLEKNSQHILNHCMKIFKKHSFNQLTNKQKECLYIFIVLMNLILTQS